MWGEGLGEEKERVGERERGKGGGEGWVGRRKEREGRVVEKGVGGSG